MRLLLFLCLLSPVAYAQVCQVRTVPEPTLPANHSRIELPDDKWILIIGLNSIPSGLRNRAVLLLSNPDPGPSDVRQMERILADQGSQLDEFRRTKDFLRQFIADQRPGFVAVENTNNSYKQKESLSLVYSPLTVSPPNQKTEALKPVREDLLLLTIEPAFFLKMEAPDLFQGVKVFGIDMSPIFSATIEPPPEQADLLSAKTNEVRRKLRQNPKTLIEFNKIVRDFNRRDPAFRGKSDEQVKEQTLRRVYEPARPLIGEWVDIKIADSRKPKEVAPATSIADLEDEIALSLFEEQASGIVMVQDEFFISTLRVLTDACKRQFVP